MSQMLSHRMPATLLVNHRDGVTEEQAAAFYFSLKDSWWERWRFGLMLCRDQSPHGHDPSNLVSLAHLSLASRLARFSSSPDYKVSAPIHNSARYQSLGRARLVSHLLVELRKAHLPIPTQKTVRHAGDSLWLYYRQLLCRKIENT